MKTPCESETMNVVKLIKQTKQFIVTLLCVMTDPQIFFYGGRGRWLPQNKAENIVMLAFFALLNLAAFTPLTCKIPVCVGLAVFALASRSTQNMTTQDIARLLVQLCPTELLFVELAFSAWTVLENLCLFVWWAWVCFVIAAGALKCLVVWRWFAAHGGNPEARRSFHPTLRPRLESGSWTKLLWKPLGANQ